MAKPAVSIHSPTNLTPTSAFLHGACNSMGGLPTKFCFAYSNPYWWKFTPWRDVDHDGETFHENIENVGWKLLRPPSPLKYKWPLEALAQAKNDDGYVVTSSIKIWLPKPTKPKLGAPWAITAFGGSCHNHSYSFEAFTDIACRLTAYIGKRKPYVSPTTHITKGVVFHHDAIVIFRYDDALNQEEAGDARTHTYDYEYPAYDHPYWILFIGTVDGKDSPSVSAPYRFLCISPPIMGIDDAFDITHESARLPGHLLDDKGLEAYIRFNYGIKPDYTANTPTLGPARSPCYYTQLITDLEPDTEYRFRAEGSHEISFPYHGISRPRDFFTLPAPAPEPTTDKCETPTGPDGFCQNWNARGQTFMPDHDYTLKGFSIRLNQFDLNKKGDVMIKLMTDEGPDQEGAVLWETTVFSHDLPIPMSQEWTYFGGINIPLTEGTSYRIVVHTTGIWLEWNGENWVEGWHVDAMHWWYQTVFDEYPRGRSCYHWNFMTHAGPWYFDAPTADQNFICYE